LHAARKRICGRIKKGLDRSRVPLHTML
jgi:hypothetical protein